MVLELLRWSMLYMYENLLVLNVYFHCFVSSLDRFYLSSPKDWWWEFPYCVRSELKRVNSQS